MNYDQWLDTYRPVTNHLTQAPYGGTMFETFGEEFDHVFAQDRSKIWTLMDTDAGLYVANGFHIVNRIGYFVTEVPFEGEGFLDVPVFDEDEVEEFDEDEDQ